MKKVFRNCVVALLTVVAMSCAQNVGGNQEEVKKVALTVETDLEVPMKDIAGFKFVLTVDNVEKSPVVLKAVDKNISSAIGEYEVGKKLNIVAKLLNGDNVIYQGEKIETINEGDNKVKIDIYPEKPMYLFWDNINTVNKFEIFNTPITGNEVFTDKAIKKSVINYTVNTKNGDVWIVTMENNNSRIEKYSYISRQNKIVKELGILENGDDLPPAITTFYDPEKQCDVVLFANNQKDGKKIQYFYEDGSREGEITMKPSLDKNITAMNFVGNDLYYADFVKGKDKNGELVLSNGKASVNLMKNVKSQIINSEKGGLQVLSEKLPIDKYLELNKPTFKEGEREIQLSAALKILDIKSIGNDLYLTGTDLGSVFRGELLKVTIPNNEVTPLFLINVPEVITSEMELVPNAEDLKKNLLGARKIFALTPKKMELLDIGYIINEGKNGFKTKNRIASINLGDYTFSSIDINEIEFNKEADSGFGKAEF